MQVLLRALSSLAFGAAALAFLFGGIVISAAADTSRLTGEIIGIALSFLLGWIGMALKSAADRRKKQDLNKAALNS